MKKLLGFIIDFFKYFIGLFFKDENLEKSRCRYVKIPSHLKECRKIQSTYNGVPTTVFIKGTNQKVKIGY